MNMKPFLIAGAVIGAAFFVRTAFAKSATADTKGVTRGGALAVSPINSKNVAVQSSRTDAGATKAKQVEYKPLAFGASAAFQNPQNRMATDKYASSAQARVTAPLRADYAFNIRSGYALTAKR